MPWSEAVDLTRELVKDPSSRVGAALGKYDHPWTTEWSATADLFDLVHIIAWKFAGSPGQRPKPYPRPWRTSNEGERNLGNTGDRSRDEVVAYLRQLGHRIA